MASKEDRDALRQRNLLTVRLNEELRVQNAASAILHAIVHKAANASERTGSSKNELIDLDRSLSTLIRLNERLESTLSIMIECDWPYMSKLGSLLLYAVGVPPLPHRTRSTVQLGGERVVGERWELRELKELRVERCAL
jgi:hypothetical protein